MKEFETNPELLALAGKKPQLRITHDPSPFTSHEPYHIPVETPQEGLLILNALAGYDLFLDTMPWTNPITDNLQELEIYLPSEGEWDQWTNHEGLDIREVAQDYDEEGWGHDHEL